MSIQASSEPAAARRTTAIAVLASFLFSFGGQALIQVGGGEPPFNAPTADIVAFFGARNDSLYQLGSYLSVLGAVAIVWFLSGLYAVLERDWRMTIALGSGIVYVAVVSVGGWELATFRLGEGIEPQLARFAFDMGNLAFATGWVSLGSVAIAAGWSIVSTRILPQWLGWWAIVAGVVSLPARAVWTTEFYLIGFALFWFWAIALCIVLLARRAAQAQTDHTSTVRKPSLS